MANVEIVKTELLEDDGEKALEDLLSLGGRSDAVFLEFPEEVTVYRLRIIRDLVDAMS